MTRLAGKRVVLTGAAGGIGRRTAHRLGDRDCELLLLDVDEDGVREVANELRGRGVEAHPFGVDLTDRGQLHRVVQEVKQRFGPVDVLINNAGLGYLGELHDTSRETWQRLVDVNFWSPVELTYALLPSMMERGEGHIVNVSSGQAFYRLPTWGAYATAKAALGVFSEVLGYELAKRGIRVTTVYPYMVNTGFYRGIDGHTLGARLAMKLVPLYSMSPERVAAILIEAVERDRKVELVSPINHVGRLAHAVGAGGLVGRISDILLTRGPSLEPGRAGESPTNGIGFRVEERMQGHHTFETPGGPGPRRSMDFRIRWGPDDIRDWVDPTSPGILSQPAEGTIGVDGLVDRAPCAGTLELRYLYDASIRYVLDFEARGKQYRFVGEKTAIRPWNLPFSHTTCFGTISEVDSGRLVSRAVVHFPMRSLPELVRSFRLVRRASGLTRTRPRRSGEPPTNGSDPAGTPPDEGLASTG